MTSGITMGAIISPEKKVFPLNFRKRANAIPARVPTIVATVAVTTAILNEISAALIIM
jgi:hypothetical protein